MVGSKVYKPSPINVHVKQCVHEQMDLVHKKVMYNKYLFTPENYKCGGCNSSDDVVFMRVPPINQVVRSCEFCGVTQPVSIMDDRKNIIAEHELFANETHEMTLDEIKAFVERNHVDKKFLPAQIRNMLKAKRVKRTVNVENLDLEEE